MNVQFNPESTQTEHGGAVEQVSAVVISNTWRRSHAAELLNFTACGRENTLNAVDAFMLVAGQLQ